MPLIPPNLNPTISSTDKQQEWMTKLMGKKITDSSGTPSDELSFAKQDLPKEHRIVEPGAMLTQDHNPERLNVHLAEDGTVRHVDFK
ncbi:MAG: hypothetical protein L6R39_001886 [Caloplaca ligustica]|nr:MAG: hypothetical protein L6R39_001886 [Caloplaca ligustica]